MIWSDIPVILTAKLRFMQINDMQISLICIFWYSVNSTSHYLHIDGSMTNIQQQIRKLWRKTNLVIFQKKFNGYHGNQVFWNMLPIYHSHNLFNVNRTYIATRKSKPKLVLPHNSPQRLFGKRYFVSFMIKK